MVEKIIWSLKAQEDRKQILNYWINRNKSTYYRVKLNLKL
jgi:plasmid stabilization system protein ParE